jgi:hypothetical protein
MLDGKPTTLLVIMYFINQVKILKYNMI